MANLELVSKVDYETTDARYTDISVEGTISQAEKWINSYCGREGNPFTGTIPDGVVFATIELSKYFMDLQMVEDGHWDNERLPSFNSVLEIIKLPLDKNKVKPNYSSSATDFNLPTQAR